MSEPDEDILHVSRKYPKQNSDKLAKDYEKCFILWQIRGQKMEVVLKIHSQFLQLAYPQTLINSL